MVQQLGSAGDITPSKLTLNEKHTQVLVRTQNGGEVRIEDGDSGTWLLFDGDCMDMLPYCRAHCCGLTGTMVFEKDIDRFDKAYGEEVAEKLIDFHPQYDEFVMRRCADGRCIALDRDTHLCTVYENRPATCQKYHCTRGANMRGWKLTNHVNRQNEH